ncbi:MAG: indolepyruvate ferredoxin oxidoreductase subunit alpha [Candidatus Muiribacteriota bacterium]
MKVIIDSDLCIKCGKCYEICPVEAVDKVDELYKVNDSKCINCLACERECPAQAVYWEEENQEENNFEQNLTDFEKEENDFAEDLSDEGINLVKTKIDDVIESMPSEKKKQLKGRLRYYVEEKVAPVVETAILLFLDGLERVSGKKNTYKKVKK